MTHKAKFAILIPGLVLLGGCSHALMRGTVAMKISDDEAHVCMGDNEVKAGDQVALFKNVCKGNKGKESDGATCEKVKIGGGEVTRTLNEHYSVVRVSPGVEFQEGTVVERQ